MAKGNCMECMECEDDDNKGEEGMGGCGKSKMAIIMIPIPMTMAIPTEGGGYPPQVPLSGCCCLAT